MNDKSRPSPSPEEQAEFAQLFVGSERRLKGYVLSLVPNWADAEEIFAETNAKLWEQFKDYDRTKNFGSWACTIAHYEVLTFRRRQQREKLRFSDALLDLVAEATTEAEEDRDARFRYLFQCMETLDTKGREWVRAFYSGLETVAEIAQRTGSTRAAVYKSVSRNRHRLHVCIENHLHKEDGDES